MRAILGFGSQEALARAANTGRTQVHNIEKGVKVEARTWAKIAEALIVPVDEIDPASYDRWSFKTDDDLIAYACAQQRLAEQSSLTDSAADSMPIALAGTTNTGIRRTASDLVLGNQESDQTIRADVSRVPDPTSRGTLTWEMYYAAVIQLSENVMSNPVRGGFRPDAVVGVNPGGAIVGGLLYLMNHRSFFFTTLWSKIEYHATSLPMPDNLIQFCQSRHNQPTRILLVDDSMKTGTTMRRAVNHIREYLASETIEIRCAVLVYLSHYNTLEDGFRPDYVIHTDYSALPYSSV